MLELQGEHGNLGNEQVAADEHSCEDHPFKTFEGVAVLVEPYDEGTPEKGIGRCRQSDEAEGLTLIEVELRQS